MEKTEEIKPENSAAGERGSGDADVTEPIHDEVKSLSISDIEENCHFDASNSEDTESSTIISLHVEGKLIKNQSLRSNSSNRCYRNRPNCISEDEASNGAKLEEEAGPSRPRSRSVEGKRSSNSGEDIPFAKYRRQDENNGIETDQLVSIDGDLSTMPVQGSISSEGAADPGDLITTDEDEDERAGESPSDEDMHLESSDDSEEMFFRDGVHGFHEYSSSSSSSEESLPDLEELPAEEDTSTSTPLPTDGDNNRLGGKKTKKDPVLLPYPLGKPKPKETWSGPKAILQREIGFGLNAGRKQVQSEQFFRAGFYGSLFSAERLELMQKLEGHQGCVNCLSFNYAGTRLASGSDDLDIKIWNYTFGGKCITSFHSGHRANVFQAKFIPFLGMDTMIVSSARDNQVRLNELSSSGEVRSSRKLAQHRGPCHKLSISPENPNVILSCGEDSFVFSIDTREDKPNRILNVREGGKKVALYSLHQNPFQPQEFCVSGKDSYVRIYDIRKLPSISNLLSQNSTCDSLTNGSTASAEGGGDVRRTSFPPLKKFCPHHLMSSDNADPFTKTNITAAVYNYNGREILASYNDEHIYLFDASHSDGADYIKKYEGHRNSMTVKGVNFFGDKSQFVVSGSDCGHIFIWDKNSESIVNFFRGDEKGVVNCLEGHPTAPILATSGLDDDIKIFVPSNENPPKMSDLASTIKRNKRKRESASNAHAVSDGFIMWALRNQMRAVRNRRRARRQEAEESDTMENSDEDDEEFDDDDDGEGGMDCVVS